MVLIQGFSQGILLPYVFLGVADSTEGYLAIVGHAPVDAFPRSRNVSGLRMSSVGGVCDNDYKLLSSVVELEQQLSRDEKTYLN